MAALLLFFIVIFFYKNLFYNKEPSSKKVNKQLEVEVNKDLTLKEAISIGLSHLKEKEDSQSTFKLFDATSVDDANSKINEGNDGTRHMWNITFVNSKNGHAHYITIKNGRVINSDLNKAVNIPNKLLIDIEDLNFDSVAAINFTKEKLGLLPGENFAIGFHFVISKTEDAVPVLTVYGSDKQDGYISKIHYNVEDGNLIAIEKKVPTGGGFYRVNGENISLVTDKNHAVIGSRLADQTTVLWGYQNPGSIFSTAYIKILKGQNETWETVNINEKFITNVWLSDNFLNDNTIYYSTDTAIKRFDIEKNEDKILLRVNSIIDFVYSKQMLAVLTDKGVIYHSENKGLMWEKISGYQGINQIKLNQNGEIFTLYNGKIHINKLNLHTKINLPKEIENIIGFEVVENQLVVYTPTSVWFLDKIQKWHRFDINVPIDTIFINLNDLNNAFVVSENTLYNFKFDIGGEKYSYSKINFPSQFIVSNVSTSSNDILISFVPTFNWTLKEEIK